jgi:hypothetical protein
MCKARNVIREDYIGEQAIFVLYMYDCEHTIKCPYEHTIKCPRYYFLLY